VPALWKRGLIVPLFKKGSPSDPGNYRPICLLSIVAKLFTRIINDVLYSWVDSMGLIPDPQGGFRHERGCPEKVHGLYSIGETRRLRGLKTFLAFVDVKKAFDTVSRPGLLLRLFELGTPEHIWAVVREFYSGDEACILMGGSQSEWFDTTLGVRQGDVASPILFSCFINGIVTAMEQDPTNGIDLGDGLPRLSILLFADDMVLLAESAEQLKRMLDVMTKFADSNRFKVSTGPNQDKSAVMVYGDPQSGKAGCPYADEVFLLCGARIPVVSTYPYLGVVLDHMGDWEPHLKLIRQRVGWRLADLRKAGMGRDGLPLERTRNLVWAEVCPLWEYCMGVIPWSPKQLQRLEALFFKAVRQAAGVRRFVSIEAILYDMDLLEALPTTRDRMYRLLMYYKIESMQLGRWVRRASQLWDTLLEQWKVLSAVRIKKVDAQGVAWHRNPRGKEPGGTEPDTWLKRVQRDLTAARLTKQQLMSTEPEKRKEKIKEALFYECTQIWWRSQLRGDTRPWLEAYGKVVKPVQYETRKFTVLRKQLYGDIPVMVEVRKKQRSFCDYLKDPHRRRREFRLCFRAGSLPLQASPKDSTRPYRCGGLDADSQCFMCHANTEETLHHFLNECTGYKQIKRDHVWNPRKYLKVQDIIAGHVPSTNIAFDMWCYRMKTWRLSHPGEPTQPFL
jgi:hypothetical protein